MDPEAFRAAARRLGRPIARWRKDAPIAARLVERPERIETFWNGSETVNDAKPGDYLATALTRAGRPKRDGAGALNQWVIEPATFSSLYEATDREIAEGRVYAPLAEVEAFYLPGGFDIAAPWGERQTADDGYLLLNGDAVYGNHRQTFLAAYRKVP